MTVEVMDRDAFLFVIFPVTAQESKEKTLSVSFVKGWLINRKYFCMNQLKSVHKTIGDNNKCTRNYMRKDYLN